MTRTALLLGATLTVLAALAAATAVPAAACSATITMLPDLGYGSGAFAIHGDTVVGSVVTATGRGDAAYWQNGQLFLPGLTRGYVGDVNARGDMVGNSSGFRAPFAIVDGVVHPLAFGGRFGYARRINNRGQIAGATDDTNFAARWDSYAARPVVLEPAPGNTFSFAKGINDLGEVAGDSDDANFTPYSAVWNRFGDVRIMYSGLGMGQPSDLFAINDRGESAGDSYIGDENGPTLQQATRWSADGMPTPIPFLPGANYSTGLELNDRGWVSGVASIAFDYSTFDDHGHHAFVWFGSGAAETLPVAGYPYGASESDAHAIGNDGTAVGSSGPAGGPDRATVWTCAQEQAFAPPASAASRTALLASQPARLETHTWKSLHANDTP